jgi:6-pyruvoyltetrahydropterin/6-carboxytetrahydropterin synthase
MEGGTPSAPTPCHPPYHLHPMPRMMYRVCKSFEVESGHMLSKHPGRCRLPHGHSRRIDLVIASERLDDRDMVCDFKALKLAVEDELDRYDHAMAVNSRDPILTQLDEANLRRVVVFEDQDPTTEALAKRIYDFVAGEIARAASYTDEIGNKYALSSDLTLERVRVTETSSSWAEYGIA